MEQNKVHQKVKSVRLILLSGEPLDTRAINYWFEYVSQDTVFYNLYGATEFLVPFYKRITQPVNEEEALQLGKLRPGFDYQLTSVPEKELELSITGTIATGYFDPNHIKASYFFLRGKRFIKTYDCVKLVGGTLYYHTRAHRLVKRYGQIINLTQIEYLLRQKYPLYNFITVANEHEENKIVLFIEGKPNNDLLDAIQLVLKNSLPGYMHPAEFLFMENFPRTPTGKIDYYSIKQKVIAFKKTGIIAFFKKFFPNQEVNTQAFIMSLGLDSSDYIELAQQCFKQTGKWLDNSQINKFTRISDLPSYLITMHFKKTLPTTAVKVHPSLVWGILELNTEIYLISYLCLDKSINFKKLESAIAQTIEYHFMLSCKIVRINEEYFFERTHPQTDFWLPKPFFKKNLSTVKVFTHSERLVYFYLQRRGKQTFLIIAFNHIALDGWSVVLLREELFRRYEGYKERVLSKSKEIELLNRINDIWLPTSLCELEQELKNINISEYTQVDKLFNGPLVTHNTTFSIPQEKVDKFIAHNHLGSIPYSVIFALVLSNSLCELIKKNKLMFHMAFSDRNLPIEGIKTLLMCVATAFPIFFNSEHKTVLECAQELQRLFSIYFKNMHYSAAAELWEKQIIERKYLFSGEFSHMIAFSYVNKINEIDYIQNKFIDWNNSINEFYAPEKVGVHFRVANLDTQFLIVLTTTISQGLHEQILNYIHRIFDL
jgi:hypothetical protein